MSGYIFANAAEAEEIRNDVLERLSIALPDCKLRPSKDDPLSYSVTGGAEGTLTLNLGNLISSVMTTWSEDAREELITAYVGMACEAVMPPAITLDRVYLGLRHYRTFDAIGGVPKDDPLFERGPGDLVSVVLSDMGSGLRVLNKTACAAAKLSIERVRAAAETNLLALLPDVGVIDHDSGAVSLSLDPAPWLGSSLLMTPGIFACVMRDRGWTRALIASPLRETVELRDADAPGAVSAMGDLMVRAMTNDTRFQSQCLWTMHLDAKGPKMTHRMDESGVLIALS
ncbi:MAG: hypothetical protein QNJ20_17840 [Paracoccaceae bacterium]|nr:hypothetical protein [Paracoccaceae bacterium]